MTEKGRAIRELAVETLRQHIGELRPLITRHGKMLSGYEKDLYGLQESLENARAAKNNAEIERLAKGFVLKPRRPEETTFRAVHEAAINEIKAKLNSITILAANLKKYD